MATVYPFAVSFLIECVDCSAIGIVNERRYAEVDPNRVFGIDFGNSRWIWTLRFVVNDDADGPVASPSD